MTFLQFRAALPAAAESETEYLKIGPGGWITDIAIAPNGRQYCQTDTHGIYGRASASDPWVLLNTTTSMGSAFGHDGSGNLRKETLTGVYAMALAPSSPTTVYMMFWDSTLYKSTDAGANWTDKTGTLPTIADNDFAGRMNGPRMAVDPNDPNNVIICTEDGTFRSTDGGTTWTEHADILDPTSAHGGCVAWHPSNSNIVYVGVNGRGVYASSDAGENFALTSSGPTTMRRMAVSSDGILMCSDRTFAKTNSGGGDGDNIWKYASATWSNLAVQATGSNDYWHNVTPDPNNAGHWYFGGDAGLIVYTANDGTSCTAQQAGTRDADSPQAGWLAATNEAYMSNGNMVFDPSLSNTMFFAHGIGVARATPPTTAVAFDWDYDSIGIEQLVTTWIDVPLGGTPIVACWDRPIFKTVANNSDYPASHGINYTYSIRHAWSWDWAKSDPTFCVVICTSSFNGAGTPQIGYSDDSGATWSEASGTPGAGIAGGSVAVATSSNWCYAECGSNSRVRYTNDGGATFAFSTLTGVPTTGETGLGFFSNTHRRILCCDDDGYFYIYTNGIDGDNTSAGIWKSDSANDGSAFTKVYNGRLQTGGSDAQSWAFNGYNAVLNAMPGVAGTLFFTAGSVSGSIIGPFFRSLDAGVTWTAVPDVLEVLAFGFGAANGAGDPSLHMIGWVDGEYGVWVSENATTATIGNITWSKKTDYPLGRSDEVTTVSGDINTYGVTYVGYRGSGAIRIPWA